MYLVPERTVQADGFAPEVDISAESGKLLVITLAINRVTERIGLVVSIWGSPDGADWGTKPMISFSPKDYCGAYSALLNLARSPDVRYLRVEWKMRPWGKGATSTEFGFYVFAEESGAQASTAVA